MLANRLVEKCGMPAIISVTSLPERTWRCQDSNRTVGSFGMFRWFFCNYNHLQMNIFAVILDSGMLPEETSFCMVSVLDACLRAGTE